MISEEGPATLRKMFARFADPIEYSLVLGDETIPLNDKIGSVVQLNFTGKIVYQIVTKRPPNPLA